MYSRAAILGYLQDDIGIQPSFISSDSEVVTARKISLQNSLLKKFVSGDSSTECDVKALDKFLECNLRCKQFKLTPDRVLDDYIIGEVKSRLHDVVGNGPDYALSLWSFSDDLDLGPGANIGVKSYNLYTKLYDSPLSTTNDHLVRLYRTAISRNPLRYRAESFRHTHYGFRSVAGNQLSFVPKTSDISRTICTEPTLNMLFQKGLGRFIEAFLRRKFNIDLSTQPLINRRLAKLGSFSGSYGTIDLESASDSISMQFCREFIPRELFSWLNLCRSPIVTLPGGKQIELDMISSMGNGFTFPLQTLIFATIVATCYHLKGIPLKDGRSSPDRNFSVFGDDIIVRSDCYDAVIHALSLFGFRVNNDKSFNSGHFRESCGEDYYRGHNVRGVYLRRLDTPADVYSAINRLVRWSANSGVYLTSLIRALRSKVKYLPIPFCDGDAEGIKVPLELALPYIGRNRDYQSYSYVALQSETFQIKLPQPRNNFEDIGDLNLHYSNKVMRRTRYYHRDAARYNPDGLFHVFIGGFIRNGFLSFRTNERAKTKFVRRFTSSWDDYTSGNRSQTTEFSSWEAASLDLLSSR
jgi:hypothetical protein